jgi:hypothetical protein
MDVLNQKQWLEKYKLCSRIEYRFLNFSKNGQRQPLRATQEYLYPVHLLLILMSICTYLVIRM